MVGKHCWRLLTHPDFLVVRVYKARYYIQGSFLNAKIGRNPSYIWISIIGAQEIIRYGATCSRVGNGLNVDILNDAWMADEENPYVVTKSKALKRNKVSSLFDLNQNQWDIDLLADMFKDRDYMLIISIPIQQGEPDSWYWKKDKMRVFC